MGEVNVAIADDNERILVIKIDNFIIIYRVN